jgi:glycosyltransferase involved in cell wall biosynthesis
MKIAILGPYPLDEGLWSAEGIGEDVRLGGVEVAIAYVQRELLKRGDVSLHILTCNPSLTEPKVVGPLADGRLTLTYLPRAGLGRVTWHRREVDALRRALEGAAPDVVHAHGSGLYAGAALASPFPAVVTVHGIATQEARLAEGWGPRLRGLLDGVYERWVIRRTQHLMLITPYVQQVFAGIFRGASYLVENACEERFFAVPRRPEAGRLFFAGPVIPRKGVLPLLQALQAVRKQAPEAHLRIAGSLASDPAYAAACRSFVAQAGLEDAVSFLGHVSQEQMLAEYSRCAAFVLPSFQETAPMVIEQAMAAGAPSVATCAGGVPWMIEEGVTGLTLPLPSNRRGDPDALAVVLLRLLRDPAAAEEMGRRAHAVARERFWPEAVAQRTLAVYEQVVAAS